MTLSRREFVQAAAAMGAVARMGRPRPRVARPWRERRDLYPEGVASGDPDPAQRHPVDAAAVRRRRSAMC